MSTPQTLPGAVKHQVIAGFTQTASRYDTGGTEFFTAMGIRLVDQAQIRPGARVLDVGCGKGAVTLPAARRAGITGRVHAIDLARPMIEDPQPPRPAPAGWARSPLRAATPRTRRSRPAGSM